MSKQNNSGNGLSFFTLLGLAFIILKLCNVIDWSWWWVLAPLWGGILLIILIVIGIVVYKILNEK